MLFKVPKGKPGCLSNQVMQTSLHEKNNFPIISIALI